jgi:hypothetical protein
MSLVFSIGMSVACLWPGTPPVLSGPYPVIYMEGRRIFIKRKETWAGQTTYVIYAPFKTDCYPASVLEGGKNR